MRPVGLDREDDDDGDNEEENIDLSVGRRIFTFAVFFYDALSGGFLYSLRFVLFTPKIRRTTTMTTVQARQTRQSTSTDALLLVTRPADFTNRSEAKRRYPYVRICSVETCEHVNDVLGLPDKVCGV